MFSPARKVVIVILAIITYVIFVWMNENKMHEMIDCGGQSVTVVQGDTLESIVLDKCIEGTPIDATIDEIVRKNNLVDSNKIKGGWVLQLP